MGKKLRQWMKAEWAARLKTEEADRRARGEITKADWDILLRTFDYKCAYCELMGDLTYDHFIPKSAGGGLTMGNVVPACDPCNKIKSNTPPEKWLSKDSYDRVVEKLREASQLSG